ncbi:DUF362 domain-containing protein [bacterium]|nr:DUF362 domain-containing protein [bacterium]
MSKVIIIKGKGVLSDSRKINTNKLRRMYQRGFCRLTGENSPQKALRALFANNEKVGIKINTIAGKKLSTPPPVSLELAQFLHTGDIPKKNLVVWDRTNRELKTAGYNLNKHRKGIQIFGTDTQDVGYSERPISHLQIGSLFSNIQKNIISSSISLAILKDHGIAGVTAGMKNYFGSIHNPNKYHDNHCDPFVAELFDTSFIQRKHRLTILDALVVQYHLGPSFHSSWAEKLESLVFGLDPVATDRVGWNIIAKLRSQKNLPSLEEEGRVPSYLFTAQKMGLGEGDLNKIEIQEEEI